MRVRVRVKAIGLNGCRQVYELGLMGHKVAREGWSGPVS